MIKASETLDKYVQRILREKNLSFADVERRAERQISDSYVCSITNGIYGSLTVSKLKALARGLDTSEDEIFAIARGIALTDEPEYLHSAFARLSKKYRELSATDQRELSVLLETLSREIERRLLHAKSKPRILKMRAG